MQRNIGGMLIGIIAFGQKTTVTDMTFLKCANESIYSKVMLNIEPSVVVPSKEYTRDYIWLNEIQSLT